MEFVKVGYITNTHGIKGDLKVYPLTDDPKRFEDDIDFFLDDNKIKVRIIKSRIYRGLVYIKLEGFNNINEVLKFKDKYIYIKEEDRMELPKGTYYISDLIGMEVINDSKVVGYIKDVLINSKNDIYLCETKNKKEFMIPAVKEFVKEIDIKNKKVYVELIEGML
ncbi:ribosome maturation factor RimM [Miniphocaeibacter halophilus]|uniref:16S rRNA processing protein RimM n=1 Tax=Miniphocaeibacter halophilus TaxID=2931922 RepID=A0AC61MP49_9FIRM|nr:ribosome maturation factor RimM [Miniphocaeibacter halophilus]QQK07310.1 16S rRNA processing protein RimM [Miniphocaeibacter halophilus]